MTGSAVLRSLVAAGIATFAVVTSAQAPVQVTVVGQTVDAISGLPVAGAEVVLSRAPEGKLRLKTTSGEDGRFVFDRVPSGTYYAFASKPGFFMAAYNDVLGHGGSDELIVGWPGPPLVTLSLLPHAGITGIVRDDAGLPVVGAKVTPLELSQAWSSWGKNLMWTRVPDVATVTDERGRYVLKAMDPGAYLIEVDATSVAIAGSPSRTLGTAFAPGERAIGNAVPVSLAARDLRVLDVQLNPQPVFTISGVVDVPAADDVSVAMQLIPAGEMGHKQGPSNPKYVWIHGDPAFVFPRVVPGDYFLEANVNDRFWGEARVTVDDQNVSNLHVTLFPPVVVSGRVIWEGTVTPPGKETVLAESAVGIADLRAVGRAGYSGLALTAAGARWSADGTFTLSVRPERYLAQEARLDGGWHLKSFRINGHEALDEPVEINSDSSGAVLILTRAMGEVRGTILDSAGRPAGGMAVLFSTNSRRWPGVFMPTPHVLETDCDRAGHFVFPEVLPGEYYLAAAPILPWVRLDDEVLRNLVPSAVRIQVVPNVPVVRDLVRRR